MHHIITQSLLVLLFILSLSVDGYSQAFGNVGTGNGNLFITDLELVEDVEKSKLSAKKHQELLQEFSQKSNYFDSFFADLRNLDSQKFIRTYDYYQDLSLIHI